MSSLAIVKSKHVWPLVQVLWWETCNLLNICIGRSTVTRIYVDNKYELSVVQEMLIWRLWMLPGHHDNVSRKYKSIMSLNDLNTCIC